MTLETDGNKTHSNEIVEQCYVDARAAEGQSCGECNMERITGGGGGRKSGVLMRKFKVHPPDFITGILTAWLIPLPVTLS